MRRLLQGITGTKTISEPLIIAVSAATKLFVGDIIETARTVLMTERKDSGAIRPGHIREACRRLKLESKVPRRSLFLWVGISSQALCAISSSNEWLYQVLVATFFRAVNC